MKRQLLAAAVIATIGVSSTVPLVASAGTSPTTSGDSSLVDKISSKFKLNKSDVQKVFDENHASHQAEREQNYKDRLAELVKDGKITQAQSDSIQAKHDETKTYMESLKDKTKSERREAMKTKADELKQWADDNGIDAKYVMPYGPQGKHGEMRGKEAPDSSNNSPSN